MSPPLHPRFLEDPAEYDNAVAAWRRLWSEMPPFFLRIDDWKVPWVDESWRDGNPIFSAWSPVLRKGIRVIQHDDQHAELVWWRNTFGKGSDDAIKELVIACAATQKTMDAVRDLLSQWLRGETDPKLRSERFRPVDVTHQTPSLVYMSACPPRVEFGSSFEPQAA